MKKRLILQEGIAILNVYVPNNTASKHRKQKWLELKEIKKKNP